MRRGILFAILVLGIACSPETPEPDADGTWVGTITTEGDVTTVINESGSVWGGTARLIEEVTIGVDAGEDAYMLGPVRAVAATDDEVYVLDLQVPALRVYDMSGRHLRDIGAEGSGPAEFRTPSSLVIGTDGRIYLRDYGNDRIMVFSPQGEEVGTLPRQGGYRTSNEMVATLDGTVYNYERIVSDDPEVRLSGMVRRSLEEDRSGEPVLPPDFGFEAWRLTARAESLSITSPVPFSPTTIWTIAPSGAVIAGVSDEYSFEIRYPDGMITRVVKRGDRVPVDPAEGEWHRKRTLARMRRNVPEWRWNGEDVPAAKPAYQRFIPDQSGRVWVIRPGPGRHVEGECNENPQPDNASQDPCWRSTVTWEVFDEDGRFLGGADIPGSVNSSPRPYIRGDMFLAPASDAAGTIMVKRYRLVLPGEQEE